MSDEPLDLTGIEARRLAALDADTWFTLDRGARMAITDALDDLEPLLDEVKRLRAQVADAWDEGYRNGYSIGYRDDPTALTNYENPYRTQPEETP